MDNANAFGLSIAFLAFRAFLMFYEHGLNFELHWISKLIKKMPIIQVKLFSHWYFNRINIFGIIFAWAQALIIRKFLPKVWPWILNGRQLECLPCRLAGVIDYS